MYYFFLFWDRKYTILINNEKYWDSTQRMASKIFAYISVFLKKKKIPRQFLQSYKKYQSTTHIGYNNIFDGWLAVAGNNETCLLINIRKMLFFAHY